MVITGEVTVAVFPVLQVVLTGGTRVTVAGDGGEG
jgi:hypothetical protein